MLKFLPIMLLSIAQKIHPLCSIIRSNYLNYACKFYHFKSIDCLIRVYSGWAYISPTIPFSKVIVLLEYFNDMQV